MRAATAPYLLDLSSTTAAFRCNPRHIARFIGDVGRVYCGWLFVVLSVLSGWRVDGLKPDVATVLRGRPTGARSSRSSRR